MEAVHSTVTCSPSLQQQWASSVRKHCCSWKALSLENMMTWTVVVVVAVVLVVVVVVVVELVAVLVVLLLVPEVAARVDV